VYSYEANVTDDHVEQHDSIQEVKSAIQQPPYCTLDDCFQLYTRDERVLSTRVNYSAYRKKSDYNTPLYKICQELQYVKK